MKLKLMTQAALVAAFTTAAYAQTTVNITGATAFRAATIASITAGYGGPASVGVVTSVASGSYTGSNAVSFRGNWPGVGDTIIRCRFSGSTEGIRDLVGTTVPGTPNDVFYYPDTDIPAVGIVTYKNQNSNPVGANVALKPDLAFSDVQQNNSPYRSPVLQPADSRVGVVTFVFLKSQGSSPNLTNVTNQAWGALLRNQRGVPLNVFTGVTTDATERVLATGRNDGSGTRAVYLIEPAYGVSRLVNQFKIGANGFNGVTQVGNTADKVDILQLWPSNDAQDANNNSVLWPTTLQIGNGGYFSNSGVVGLLTKDTSSVTVLGPTGALLSGSGSYVATTTPRPMSVIGFSGTSDAVGAIAANDPATGNGGAGLLSYEGTTVTPITGTPGFSPADYAKITRGHYTVWSYERLYNRGTLDANQTAVVYGAGTGLVATIPGNLANAGIPLSAMIALRVNDGDVVTQP